MIFPLGWEAERHFPKRDRLEPFEVQSRNGSRGFAEYELWIFALREKPVW